MNRVRALLLVITTFVVAGCPGSKPPPIPPKPAPAAVASEAPVAWRMSKSGVGFRLSDAEPLRPTTKKPPNTKVLSAKETGAVLARLPKMTRPPEKKAFAMRAKSIPAPRPGETIKTPFPPSAALSPPPAEPDEAGPLRVLRYAPEGDLEVAPNLSLTFSQPMVAVTSHADLAKTPIPVRLSPEPPGKWRWLGTQTVLFEPAGERFPMSTDYDVEVPGGTRAASGGAMADATRFRFSLPTLRMEAFHPDSYERTDLDPVMFILFNQKIDRNAIASALRLTARNEDIRFRFATDEEIEGDRSVRAMSQNAPDGQWIALRAEGLLPKDAAIVTILRRDAPSAEGPKRTTGEQSRTFHTYGPMRLERTSCWWGEKCPPLAPWTLEFSNPIDPKKFDKGMVTVEPLLLGMKVEFSHGTITIRGLSKGRTKYTIRVAESLTDRYGQTLERPAVSSIDVSRAEPVLFPEQMNLTLLDPAFGPKLSVYSVNHASLKVRLLRVRPEEWGKYGAWKREWDQEGKLIAPPGRLVKQEVVRTRKAVDELVETLIDLGPALEDGFGQVLVIVEPTTRPKRDRWGGIRRESVRTWVQVTKLGLQAFADADDLYGWASSLSDGSPVDGVSVSILGRGASATTDATGIAKVALPFQPGMLVGTKGPDSVMVPEHDGYWYEPGLQRDARSDSLRWLVFDDRRLYKPGERVNVKGFIRLAEAQKGGDLSLPAALRSNRVSYTVFDPRGAEIGRGESPLDDAGSFQLAFDLANNANLGSARVHLDLSRSVSGYNNSTDHNFEIQEFRRPEYEVTATVSDGPHSVGRHAIATVNAAYYAGGGLADAETAWEVRATDAHYVPPNRDSFHFGKPITFSWWGMREEPEPPEVWKARTNGEGTHRLRIDFDALDPAYPRSLALEATVTDVNRQAWTGRSELLVHPGSLTVGMRQDGSFVRAGQNLHVALIATDLDGKAAEGVSIKVKSGRVEREWAGDEFIESEVDVQPCDVASKADPVDCNLPTREAGLHRITAEVVDQWGRKSHTSMNVWVMGTDGAENPGVEAGRVEVLPSKKEFAGGDTAELLVLAPFAPAEGVLTLRRQGVVELRRFRMERPTAVLTVPIDPKWVPNVTARVDLVGAAIRENEAGDPDTTLPKRPAFASGSTRLGVPPTDRSLAITVRPAKRFASPGSSTTVTVDVKDAAGAAVSGGRVALVVVDESVLALTGYEFPDPLEVFYADRPDDVRDLETRFRVALMRPDTSRMQIQTAEGGLGLSGLGFGGGGSGLKRKSAEMRPMAKGSPAPAASSAPRDDVGAPEESARAEAKADKKAGKTKDPSSEPMKVRSDFSALAAFLPSLTTDANGRATAKVKLPDSLTRYRIVAVASSGDRSFGKAENAITARLALMVRPSLPRFLNYGDAFELPVVLQNQTGKDLSVEVAARAANALLPGPTGLRVTVPANDRVEVRFPAAARMAGTAKFQVGAVSSAGTDANEQEIPVWTPATTEAFATYGQVDQGAIAQKVQAPSGVVTDYGGLEITTSSTALQGLTDAVLYLVRYPFECNEQISSRVLAIAALKDVLTAFEAEGLPPKSELIASMKEDMKKLRERQHWSGGWDYWRFDRNPDPYVSIHVTHALTRAKDKGFDVPAEVVQRALQYLRGIRNHIPSWWPESVKHSIEAYALYTRNRAGDPDPADAQRILREAGGVKKVHVETLGWLMPVLEKDDGAKPTLVEIVRHLENRMTETAGKAHFATSYEAGEHFILASSRRADGILLESLIGHVPSHDIIPKLVKGLLGHRTRGRWYNTQENAFILLALDRYFNTYEKVTPDFVARAWLGDGLAAEHAFRGRSVDYKHVDIPMSFVAQQRGVTDLVIAKDGPGRLYYRVGMQYAPRDLRPPPAEHGFTVMREYEGVDTPDDVRADDDGVWHVKAGALVRVRLKMVARSRRYHVALVDPIPAGFEPMNPALATTGTVPEDPEEKSSRSKTPWWWSRTWYEHTNMRDDRVEAFTTLLWSGVYDFNYVARATTPGNFVVPPPKAEEMYDPETFGRGAGDRVIVH